MNLAQARRFARHVALPEIGPEGQQRIFQARIVVVDAAAAAAALETAVLYLAAAGASDFVVISDTSSDTAAPPWLVRVRALGAAGFAISARPTSGSAWRNALAGASVVVRADFADDSLLDACRAAGIAAVVVRTRPAGDGQQVDVLSFRPASGSPGSEVPSVPPSPAATSASPSALEASAQVLAGSLAAAEALWLLCGRPAPGEDTPPPPPGHLQHLALPLGIPAARPNAYTIPWPSRS